MLKQKTSDTSSDSRAAPALAVSGASKRYGPVHALQSMSLELQAGEVHALVGENGSGKSTLVGIVSGTVKSDSGTVEIAGTRCVDHAPWESQRLGAMTVFQDGSVLPDLTVAQNLYLGTPNEQRPAYRRVNGWAEDRIREFGLGELPVGVRAESLSAADRQLLEIARAMMCRPKLLLLDEATSALDAAGVDVALDMMRRAAEQGCAVLFVTHRLSEVFRVADRISVLRDGIWCGTHAPSDVDADRLVELMAGASVEVEFPPRATEQELGPPVLTATGLRGDGYGPVDLTVRRGEIVGIAGADDNGQLDLLRGLCAADGPGGSLKVAGAPIRSFGDAVSAGVAYLSNDRRSESLFSALDIRENLVVGVLGRLATAGIVRRGREKAQIRESIDDFGIRLGSPDDPITSLSGGNQQKVALGRVLATKPDVMLIDEPTQGVDVRARLDIYRLLREHARAGLGVVLVSSDASELAGLCDRVIVLSRGVVVAEIPGETATEERIVHAFASGSELTAADAASEAGPDTVGPTAGPARPAKPGSAFRQSLRRYEEAPRLLLLLLLILLIGGYAQSQNDTFLTTASLYNVLLVALPLAAVAASQFFVLFTGGIDISVGAVMGVTIALMSFWVQSGAFLLSLAISIAISIGVGVLVGSANAALVERVRISPVIATIATLGILQGVGLALRPTADGPIAPDLLEGLSGQIGFVPWPLAILAVLFVLADRALRSSGVGLRLRAVGLNPDFAFRLGVNAARLRQASYLACSVFAAFAGVLLAAQVGVGDSTVGDQFTLLAIAAPVLGGASLLGGRGTLVGCLLGAVLLALAQSLPTTLGLRDGVSYFLIGGLTLAALLVYSSRISDMLRTMVRRLRSAGSTPRALEPEQPSC